jgi:small subunit ribosomal protein S3
LGQKINPIGLRVAVDKDWRSRWFATKRTYGTLLSEDLKIRDVVKQRLEGASLARVDIERYANRVRVSLHTARPGAVLGRKGQELEKMRQQIAKFTGKEIYIEIQEIRDPDCNAQLVAENIALQMERRVSFRRAMKRAIKMAMDLGAEGIKIRARRVVWAVRNWRVLRGTRRVVSLCTRCVRISSMVLRKQLRRRVELG